MTRRKIALTAAGLLAGLVVIGAALILLLRSDWVHEQLRQRLVATVEDATGGRAEIGSFQFDWKQLRIDLGQFTVHGTEPAGKPPLFQAKSAAIGLKLISLWRRDVKLQSLDVVEPRIDLIVGPDGRTNLPEPKVKRRGERSPIEALLNLAVDRFNFRNGIFEVDARSKTPFNLRGRNLDAAFGYESAAPRYHGDISIQSLDVRWDGQTAVPLGVRMAVTLEPNRLGVSSAHLFTGGSTVNFSGALEDLASPRAAFRFDGSLAAADLSRILRVQGLEGGKAQLAGTVRWDGGAAYSATGNLHASGVALRQSRFQFRNGRADGDFTWDAQGLRLSKIRFSGDSPGSRVVPASGRIGVLLWRGRNLDLREVSLDALGGNFSGNARLENYDRFQVRGDLLNFDTRHAVSLYSAEPLPWDGRVSGPVSLDGSLRRSRDLRASLDLTLSPAAQGPPVRGHLTATYDAANGALDLGHTTVELPASRVELSGAIGRRLQVHFETRDFQDLLPALGARANTLPVRLRNGSAVFDGAVAGRLEDPRVSGRLTALRISYDGKSFDRFEADLTASRESVQVRNAVLARGGGRADFHLDAGLRDWKPLDTASLSGGGTVRNEPVADLLLLAGRSDLQVSGTVSATGQIFGTVGNPQASGDIEITKGSFRGEPFDRLSARAVENGTELQVLGGQVSAGARQVRFNVSLQHAPKRFDTGRLAFQIQSNGLPLDQLRTLAQARPGIRGTLQVSASGAIDLSPGSSGAVSFRIAALQADLDAKGLQLTGQPLGDARLTAETQGGILRTHLNSSFADSTVHGEGQWRLADDYPGSATITFSRLDFAALRGWIAPARSGAAARFGGFAEGELRLNGPLLKLDLMRADLRIPSLEIRPSPEIAGFVLRNSGPVTATIANSVVTVGQAALTGPSTKFAVSGKISLAQREPLDLSVNGDINLAVLETLDSHLTSSGVATAAAAIRGPLSEPQVNGRLQIQNADLTYGNLPNGLSNGNGVILFSGEQATIQSFSGETGGGKVQLSGFAGYTGLGPPVIRLRADGKDVRIRYPEGISTVSDSTLNLTGTSERSLLSGTVTIKRATVNLQSDFSSLLAKSAEPVRTPAAQAGFLGGMNFDVQIQTAPDVQFESSLTQGIEADANLRLRGTAASPALLGRVNITRGQVIFFGAKYSVSQGSISFLNSAKIEPVLNVDLETRARGIDITMTVAGPLNQLQLTPRSDPPLQFNEIVSVLTTGENPAAESMRLGQQTPGAGTSQQSTGSALLGQVLSSPVSGRLQRFFGISKLRIDPTLPGVEYNPLARITLEQQVTPDITFTYITNITSANPQVVSVEWAWSKQWSAYASREENGEFGLQFFFKKQFK